MNEPGYAPRRGTDDDRLNRTMGRPRHGFGPRRGEDVPLGRMSPAGKFGRITLGIQAVDYQVFTVSRENYGVDVQTVLPKVFVRKRPVWNLIIVENQPRPAFIHGRCEGLVQPYSRTCLERIWDLRERLGRRLQIQYCTSLINIRERPKCVLKFC